MAIDTANSTVAEINGVGCSYTIRFDHGADSALVYEVLVASGPVERLLAGGLSWTEAMDRVRDEVAQELADNA